MSTGTKIDVVAAAADIELMWILPTLETIPGLLSKWPVIPIKRKWFQGTAANTMLN